MEFNTQQKEALQRSIEFIDDPKSKLLRIGGYAGTGKTTILKEVNRLRPGGCFSAFAGKACDVLRRKGLPAQTIHSLIYKWDEHTQQFYLLPTLPYTHGFVDEGSMVGSSLWSDYTHFGVKTIVVGDPGQLEPVDDDDPHLMRDPDLVLEEIHRQALGNPIIGLSIQIREENDPDWRRFEKKPSDINTTQDLLWPDVIICGFNRSRVALNKAIRKIKGYEKHLYNEGERLICKNNDRALGVYNGQMFTVTKIWPDGRTDLVTDDGLLYSKMTIADIGFNALTKPAWSKLKKFVGKAIICDYGPVITCHASQGSEFDKVSYVDEQCDLWSPTRHRYTGVTRAAKELRVYKEKD